jgi:uncharacterized SAM-binding protein YcdF (DUF218 family)
MYAIFSWIFTLFISPLNWALVLMLVALLSKNSRWKKRMLVTAMIILIVFSNKFLLEMYSRAWNVEPVPLEKGKVYSAAIVLGGFTSESRYGTGFFNDHADRLVEAVTLKSTGKVATILVSGGNEQPNGGFTEAGYVHRALREMNFPDSVILVENRSTNTVTNAKFTREVLDAKHLKGPYVLVTSAFHMRRSMYIFKKNGMDVIPYSCDYIAGNNHLPLSEYIVPNVNTLYDWSYYLKEFFGLIMTHVEAT